METRMFLCLHINSKWRKYMETRMFLCLHVYCKHKNMRVSMYFLHFELTFTPHYIITDKGLAGWANPLN